MAGPGLRTVSSPSEWAIAREAREALEQLVRLRRHSVDWMMLGLSEAGLGDDAAAIAALERGAEINPYQGEIHKHRARLYDKTGDAERAARHRQWAEGLADGKQARVPRNTPGFTTRLPTFERMKSASENVSRFSRRWRLACCSLGLLLLGCEREPGRYAPTPAQRGVANDASASKVETPAANMRKFRFFYAATITGLLPGKQARIWAPLASSSDEQTIEIEEIRAPGETQCTREPKFDNALLYVEAAADAQGEIPLAVDYLVTRRSVGMADAPPKTISPAPFLAGSSLVPADGSMLKRFYGDGPPSGSTREIARAFYDRVESHMNYDKSGEGWGRGDALWACDSRRGNCSDFHSVFIALCRDLRIPAKFEIGFSLPGEPGKGEIAGYHCWARFLDEGRWIGVDISEADKRPERKDFFFGNLPPDRVMFSTERDLELAPKQAGGPVNFLIYPYVEVDGKPYAKQRRRFAFEDLP